MQVSRIMTRAVDCVSPRTTIERVARMMRDGDIVVRAVAEDKMPMATRVADVMTRDVGCCNEIDEIEKVIAQMGRAQVRRMTVDRNQFDRPTLTKITCSNLLRLIS